MKLRPIEASLQVANRATIKTERHEYHPSVEMRSPSSLKPSERNARIHSKKQVRQIAGSLTAFRFIVPVLVDENDVVIAGHGRLAAAILLGLTKVPVIAVTHLNDAEKRALALADNKIAANAGWDRAKAAAELSALIVPLSEIELDISITGFDTPEIDGLAADFVDSEGDPADSVPSLSEGAATAEIGDLWHLGDHRLYCGDACDYDCLARLMGNARASMLFSDPPYNLRIKAIVGRGSIKHREFLSGSGEMSDAQFDAFSRKWMSSAARFCADGSLAYICMDWRHLTQVQLVGNEIFTELKNIIVWVKNNAGQGSLYRSQHEFILLFKNGTGQHQNNIELGRHGRNRSNVWSYPGANSFRSGRLADLAAHPTVKPVALVADAIRDCSPRRGIILDPFMGSGTTILAAEKVGRRAYGIEIDPQYVDVAIRRWQDFTGRDAVLETGETYDEIVGQRAAVRGRKRRRERL
ncbi:DNA methyltransferase [Bradyrhizobium sp. AUGA SZCCT0182]|uniref:site-specific DNA-methyltransferase n=1 Tax=Bradyrhizobium sp. AUGA SZCCT0182 TaxID=2807667 RepID=UPI002010F06D|nr:DNA methyltransferase [Bradyrhizobium sp. AUGA SZCCT0182]